MNTYKFTVSKTKNEENTFSTIKAALDAASKVSGPVLIVVEPGFYQEKLTINRPLTTIAGLGQKPEEVCISFGDFANDTMEDGSKRGTFRSYSVFVDADNVTLKNLTIENSSGDSKTHGQAIALYAEGDMFKAQNIRLLGHQDTLFTGPLPPKEIKPGGFIGPKQFAPRINGRQQYIDCYICGDVDFIFGSATAYFKNCTIESLFRDESCSVQGYVTAASTAEGQAFGYVFDSCHIISKDCPQNSVYLGRPWRDFAKTVYLNCDFGAHINPEGFHDWNKPQAHSTFLYAEYNNTLDGKPFISKADFVKHLNCEEAKLYSSENILKTR